MSARRYRPGDMVACRSDEGARGWVTPGKVYEVVAHEALAGALGLLSRDPSLMVTVVCDDGKARAVNKVRFVPATEVVARRGPLCLVRAALLPDEVESKS